MFEKIFLIHNPLNGSKDWISERDFSIGSDKLRNVFGVLYLNDVQFMLQFNNHFKKAVMDKYKITNESDITLAHVCQLISKVELIKLMNQDTETNNQSDTAIDETYPTRIELKDGCFSWNKENGCYDKIIKAS